MNKSLASLEKKKFEVEIYIKQHWTRKYFQIDDEKVILLNLNNTKIEEISFTDICLKAIKNVQRPYVITLINHKNKQSFQISFKTELSLNSCLEKLDRLTKDINKKQFNKSPVLTRYSEFRKDLKHNIPEVTRSWNLSSSKDSVINQKGSTPDEKLKTNKLNLNRGSTPIGPKRLFKENFVLNKGYEGSDLKAKKHLTKICNLNMSHFFEDQINRIDSTREKYSIQSKDKIDLLVKDIENFRHYIFDSYMLKMLLKSNGLKKRQLGDLFNLSSKEYLKKQFFTEMLAYLAKRFLKESIKKSFESVLYEKSMSKAYFILPSHYHSVESCIVDVFNIFLGSSKESNEFYSQTILYYIKETFLLSDEDIEAFLKDSPINLFINRKNLFVSMQYHCKVYFLDSLNINFDHDSPIVIYDIKYVSPYLLLKIVEECPSKPLSNDVEGSNVKKMKTFQIETDTDSFDIVRFIRNNETNNHNERTILIKTISSNMLLKRYEVALKLCEYYNQKYAESIFLNSYVYIVLSEIYFEIEGVHTSQIFYEKSKNILLWQFGDDNPFLIDVLYCFSSILMKNEEKTKGSDNLLEGIFKELIFLCEKFFENTHEKSLKCRLQLTLYNFSRLKNGEKLDFKEIFDEFTSCIETLQEKGFFKECFCYVKLFADNFLSIVPEEKQKEIKEYCFKKKSYLRLKKEELRNEKLNN